ncbi:MAG: glycosyltransferase family 4 protein [Kiritimatiellae bacterium]|nr:glycosyltransferase family 4 protein [Kiritimatiellia bacterium]
MSNGHSHILWLTERYPPMGGGMAVSCARQTAGLRGRGLDLDVACLAGGADAISLRSRDRDGGIDVALTYPDDRGTAAQRVWRLVRERHAVAPYAFVVGFGCNFPGCLAVTYAAWLGRPSLVLVRGNDFDRDWFDRRAAGFVREALSRAAVIGAVAPDTADRIRALFPDRDVRWIPNAVNVGDLALLPDDRRIRDEIVSELGVNGRRIVGMFGELKYKKRAPLWLGALRDTGKADRVSLLIVGRMDEETRQILADPALAPLHRHVSFREQESLTGYYAACDYIALPSLFEGMPNVLLEAMAAGVVPITSDAGAMKNVITDGETGFMFPAENRAAAAAATARALALSDPDLAAMRERVRQQVADTFPPERELDALCEVLAR